MTETAVTLTHVTKKIQNKNIIKDLSFSIPKGEVFGFIGPNGAGKTTTIRMIVGLISITEGDIEICGKSIKKISKLQFAMLELLLKIQKCIPL